MPRDVCQPLAPQHERHHRRAGVRLGFRRVLASETEAAKYGSEPGVEWVGGGAERQCDRALGPKDLVDGRLDLSRS